MCASFSYLGETRLMVVAVLAFVDPVNRSLALH